MKTPKPDVFMECKVTDISEPKTGRGGARYVRARVTDGKYWHTIMAFGGIAKELSAVKIDDEIKIEAKLQYYQSETGQRAVLAVSKVEMADGSPFTGMEEATDDEIPF